MSHGYGPPDCPIYMLLCVAFQSVYSTRIFWGEYFSQLLVFCVSDTECNVQIGLFQ